MRRIRILLVIAALAMSLCLFGCDMLFGGEGHACEFVVESETKPTCESEGEKVLRCYCGKTTTEKVDKLEHTVVCMEKKEPTCTSEGREACEYCSVCKVIISGGEKLEMTDHTVVIDPATEKTDTTPAKTEGKHCSVCGYVIVKQEFLFSNEYSNPNSYDGEYAYNSLRNHKNADKLTKLYNLIDEKADYFHTAGIDAPNDNVVATIKFDELGLSVNEALAVWSAYRTDHPLYYWISSSLTYTDEFLNLVVYEEYSDGDTREALNTKIYQSVKEYVEEAGISSSTYTMTLAFHDNIILAVDYSYEADGKTPSSATSAHNIIGVFDTGLGVCESYAKSFQLLLNFCDIDNVIVSGYAGEAHAWNMVKLDDGKWYWYDLTWDDTPEFMFGISYRYFAVNDTETLRDADGPWVMAEETFLTKHTPYGPGELGIDYNYEIPARSDSKFDSADIMLRDTFTVDNLVYTVLSYNSVQLVYINSGSKIVVPETVEYKGTAFDVVSIGRIEGGLLKTGSIAYDYSIDDAEQLEVISISVPKTVKLIWDNALNIDTLTDINVDAANAAYTSVDGVLFTKDLSVLVKYPSGKSAKNYVVPEETVKIAAGAFRMFYINMEMNLESITLGENTTDAGVAHYGYGYIDTSNGNYEENEWTEIRKYLSGESKIYSKDGSVFTEE